MKSKLKLKLQFVNAGLVAALGVAGSAVAQTLAKEGNYDITNCWSGTSSIIQFSKSHSVSINDLVGNSRSNPPGGAFDMSAFRCVTLGTMIDGKASGSYYCETIDKDGDKFLVRGTNEGPKGKLEAIAGTGKYEGMVRTGTTESLGVFPPIKTGAFTSCNRQTGTYKLK
jgi:hypothetical protein